MQLMYKVLMGGHHLPYPLPGFLTTTLSTQSMKALPAKGLQSFFKSVVEDVTESEYAPIEGNSCAAHCTRHVFGPRVQLSFGHIGPNIAGPNVQANSSSWISLEGQGMRMRSAAHTAPAPTAD